MAVLWVGKADILFPSVPLDRGGKGRIPAEIRPTEDGQN